MKPSILFLQFQKVDVASRRVSGRATAEERDRQGETWDYATSVPHVRAWSNDAFEKTTATGVEPSLGNVRGQHGKVAAGKLVDLQFDDANRTVDVTAEIVDDAEWEKCLKGVYTGFSFAGNVLRRWNEGGERKFTGQPNELSIVDRPAVGSAYFTMVKADGSEEQVLFEKAATDDTVPEPFAKSIDSVTSLASILESVSWLAQDAAWEALYEGDQSPIPAQLRAWVASGVEILRAMTVEETAELMAKLAPAQAMKFAKAGARHSAADREMIQGVHDMSMRLGATCDAGSDDDSEKFVKLDGARVTAEAERDEALGKIDTFEKTAAATAEQLTLLAQQVADRDTSIATLVGEVETFTKALFDKGVLRVVDKAEDNEPHDQNEKADDANGKGSFANEYRKAVATTATAVRR